MMIQLELPGMPHGPLLGEEVYRNDLYLGTIIYVHPVTKLWAGDELTGYMYHVDVFSAACHRYIKIFMHDAEWTGERWEVLT